MAGNRELYNESMNKGYDAVWSQDWAQAAKYYSAAVQEFPEDGEAHLGLGLALLNNGRLDDSLRVYKRAHQLLPDDPTPLERSADVLERLGRLKEAAQQYIGVADVYLTLRDLDKAIGNWERATQLTPGLVAIHARLAQAYERVGDKRRALREFLTLAFNFQRMGDTDKAIKAVERALRIDRRHPQALNTLRALRSGGAVSVPEFEDEEDEAQKMVSQFGGALKQEEEAEADPTDDLGPIGEAMREALVLLADYIAESGQLDMATASVMQGMELQRQTIYDRAIQAYETAMSDIDHSALRFNLGAMRYMEGQPEEAIQYLSKSVDEKKLAAGALHGLGLSCLALDRQKHAARYLLQSLQAVDVSLVVSDQERSELSSLYSRLLSSLDGSADDTLRAINRRFVDLLQGQDWKSRIPATRKHIAEVLDTQGDQGVRDFLSTAGGDKLASMVASIDSYISRGLFTLAMDEAHEAVTIAPHYLPIHVRMAEVMMREGRLRQAINKYDIIAKAYMAREELDRAASVLGEALEIAPLDVSVRMSLITLLESEERMDEVLTQYVELGRTYNQLGDFDAARETFQMSERIARRIDAPAVRMVEIKHSLAEMEQIRTDMRSAIRMYEEILDLDPNNEQAFKLLIELNFNQANNVEAIKYIDRLLRMYAKQREINKIIKYLERMVKTHPNNAGLRSRLAAIYQQTRRKDDAIEQLDALGEIQLKAGLRDDARNTIKKIISMNPDNVTDYKLLLSQLR